MYCKINHLLLPPYSPDPVQYNVQYTIPTLWSRSGRRGREGRKGGSEAKQQQQQHGGSMAGDEQLMVRSIILLYCTVPSVIRNP